MAWDSSLGSPKVLLKLVTGNMKERDTILSFEDVLLSRWENVAAGGDIWDPGNSLYNANFKSRESVKHGGLGF